MRWLPLLFTAACAAAAPEPAAQACPQGSSWNGGACSPVLDTSCPPGMQFLSGQGCVPVVAQTATPPAPPPPPAEPIAQDGVPRAVWIRRMIVALPPRICTAAFFQQCFVATEQECETAVSALTRVCIRRLKSGFPPFFDGDSGTREGTKVGECVGTDYQLQMEQRGKFMNNAACNDPTRWQ